jgi:hypothetical protein
VPASTTKQLDEDHTQPEDPDMNAKLLDIERRYGREFAKQAAKAQLIERVCDADDVTGWRIDAPAAPPRVVAADDSPRARAWRAMIAYNSNREDASPPPSAAEARRRMITRNRNGGRC